MQKNRFYKTVAFSLLAAGLLIGCGSDTSKKSNNKDKDSEGKGSNIPYLRDHYKEYKEHGSSMAPKAVKDANKMTINWTITADTVEGATKLKEHLAFMEARLQGDKNPRAWDKLFLMEAYMKYNGHYTTSVEQTDKTVVVSKKATTACAYDIISAHADAVGGDFFGKGDIKVDYSARAESILSSAHCNTTHEDAEKYISKRQKTKGHGKDDDHNKGHDKDSDHDKGHDKDGDHDKGHDKDGDHDKGQGQNGDHDKGQGQNGNHDKGQGQNGDHDKGQGKDKQKH